MGLRACVRMLSTEQGGESIQYKVDFTDKNLYATAGIEPATSQSQTDALDRAIIGSP